MTGIDKPQADGDSHGYCREVPRRMRNCPMEACQTLGVCCAGGASKFVDTSPTWPGDKHVPAAFHAEAEAMWSATAVRGGSIAGLPLLTDNVVRRPVQMMPLTSQARKDAPICAGVLDYFPLAIAAVSRLSKMGNDKHNPGQPLHWSRGKSSDHADCIVRHLIDRCVPDVETGMSHTVEVAWRALALLQEEEEQRLGLPFSRGSR